MEPAILAEIEAQGLHVGLPKRTFAQIYGNELSPEQQEEVWMELWRYLSIISFMRMHRGHQGKTRPSIWVNRAWHELILCTKLYAQVCDKVVGSFIHHTPVDPSDESADADEAYALTLEHYRAYYKNDPQAWIWPEPPRRGNNPESTKDPDTTDNYFF